MRGGFFRGVLAFGLVGSLAIVAGALWPHRLASRPTSQGAVQSAWSSLYGWTPEG